MADAGLTRRLRRVAVPVAVLLLLLTALYLAADAEGLGAGYARYYPYVFVFAAVALLALVIAIVARLWRLRRQLRRGVPGARLARRLVLMFSLIAMPPVLLVYVFGVRFVEATVDSWFQANSRAALEDALAIAQRALNQQLQEAQDAADTLAREIEGQRDARLQDVLDARIEAMGARQLAVYSRDGRLRALAGATPDALAPEPPEDTLRLTAQSRGRHAQIEPQGDGLRLRVLAAVDGGVTGQRLLQALYAVPDDYAVRARGVEAALQSHRQASFLRESLKLVFVLILSFVLLLSLLLALLLAFDVARRLTAPIARLSGATQAVAAGDYRRRVEGESDDDLGALVSSFNRMVGDLAEADAREKASAAETERQRAHLQTVLSRLSAGVIGLDARDRVSIVNPAADVILGAPLGDALGDDAGALGRIAARAAPLVALLRRRRDEGAREFREEVALEDDGGRQLLMVRGAALPDGGVLAVFDDSTGLDRARRDAAWSEVARRLAHEVKNPLTPIQLAAERLRRRVLPKLDADDAEVLDRATHTIVGQVEALKTLVNAFSDYARPPALRLKPIDLNALVREVLDLYEHGDPLTLGCELDPDLPRVTADADRIRQVLHNLLKNAIEASAGRVPEIDVATRAVSESGRAGVEVEIADRGPGLPPGFDAGWFEPYRTTKPRGTGLGLAIVRKIAEEHGGQLTAANRDGGGAVFTLRLPV